MTLTDITAAGAEPRWAVRSRPMHRTVRRWPGPVAGLVVLAMAGAGSAADKPPPSVIVQSIKTQDITDRVTFVGNVEAMQAVDLRARVEGVLEKVAFAEGDAVEKGAVLYQIEQAPYRYALAQVTATVAAGQAQLASANAMLKDKQLALTRQTDLARQQFAAQATLDQAVAARDAAAASVQQADAAIDSAKAQVDTAALNLSYTTVASPIAGRIGKTKVTAGNLVSSSTGVLATVVQVSPTRVVFAIPERDYVSIMKFLATPGAKAAPGKDDLYQPRLVLPDGSAYPQVGKIEFINNAVDTATGTVAVRAVFDNPQGTLLPGEYVSVTVQTGQAKSAPVVASAAIQRNAQGAYVFAVDKDGRVQLRPVTLGLPTETGYAVESGLEVGETVIVDGVQKVRPGMLVKSTHAPAAAPEGQP